MAFVSFSSFLFFVSSRPPFCSCVLAHAKPFGGVACASGWAPNGARLGVLTFSFLSSFPHMPSPSVGWHVPWVGLGTARLGALPSSCPRGRPVQTPTSVGVWQGGRRPPGGVGTRRFFLRRPSSHIFFLLLFVLFSGGGSPPGALRGAASTRRALGNLWFSWKEPKVGEELP